MLLLRATDSDWDLIIGLYLKEENCPNIVQAILVFDYGCVLGLFTNKWILLKCFKGSLFSREPDKVRCHLSSTTADSSNVYH